MLIERYEPVNLFELIPLERDDVLDKLDRLLDDDSLFQAVKHDLAQRYPNTRTLGRRSTPVEVILRMLVVKHLYKWSYEQTETFHKGPHSRRSSAVRIRRAGALGLSGA